MQLMKESTDTNHHKQNTPPRLKDLPSHLCYKTSHEEGNVSVDSHRFCFPRRSFLSHKRSCIHQCWVLLCWEPLHHWWPYHTTVLKLMYEERPVEWWKWEIHNEFLILGSINLDITFLKLSSFCTCFHKGIHTCELGVTNIMWLHTVYIMYHEVFSCATHHTSFEVSDAIWRSAMMFYI